MKSSISEFFFPKNLNTIAGAPFFLTPIKKFIIDVENEYFDLDETGYLILSKDHTIIYLAATGITSELIVPGNVTTIYWQAFRSSIFSNIIISNPTQIPSYCFGYCQIESMIIPEGITTIGNFAFELCVKLTKIILPSTLQIILDSAFVDCVKLTSVVLPEGIKFIHKFAFQRCTSLMNISIPSSVQYYGPAVFSECNPELVINFNNNSIFTFINQMVFINNEIVEYIGSDPNTEIIIPRFCTSIPNGVFTSKYIFSIIFEEGFQSMTFEQKAFSNCHLESIIFPPCLSKIGQQCFYRCNELKLINFSNTQLTTIESSAFAECKSLEIVIFDNSKVTTIGDSSFANDVKLIIIKMSNSQIETIGTNAFLETSINEIQFPNTINQINELCFCNCINMKSVIIPSDSPIDVLEKFIFQNCQNLIKFILNNQNTIIKDYSFFNCLSIQTFTLSKNTDTIGMRAFQNCIKLKTINIPNDSKLNCIMPFAFLGCLSFSYFNLSDNNNVVIDGSMLLNANHTEILFYFPTSKQKTIILPKYVEQIPDYAFHSCHNIVEVYFPNGNCKSIGYQSFINCTKLSRVILPESLQIIQNDAFSFCNNIKCGCFEIPLKLRTKFQWDKIGINSYLYNDYCISKKCYISHARKAYDPLPYQRYQSLIW